MLAEVSVDYYVKMERGGLGGVSPEILNRVARALFLDDAETDHLYDLALAANSQSFRPRRKPNRNEMRPSLQRFLDAATAAPVWVRDRRMTFVAANLMGRSLFAPLLEDSTNQNNTARFMFLNPKAQNFFPDWERGLDDVVATMRSYAGQHPRDKVLTNLIGELVTRSDEFDRRWATHNVRHHRTGVKCICHPEVADLELTYEALDLPRNPEWSMFAFTAEPGSFTEERLKLLGSLAASSERVLPAANHV